MALITNYIKIYNSYVTNICFPVYCHLLIPLDTHGLFPHYIHNNFLKYKYVNCYSY